MIKYGFAYRINPSLNRELLYPDSRLAILSESVSTITRKTKRRIMQVARDTSNIIYSYVFFRKKSNKKAARKSLLIKPFENRGKTVIQQILQLHQRASTIQKEDPVTNRKAIK